MLSSTISLDRRLELRKSSNYVFTDRQHFCALLTSRGRFDAFNDYPAALRGIIDQESGQSFVIEVEKLFPVVLIPSE